jgi:hypothetical protein
LTSFSSSAKSTLAVIDMTNERKRDATYTVDLGAGTHRYVSIEGFGECRERFAALLAGMEQANFDVVVAAHAELLFVDTSPMWIEKFIATAQRHHITVADVTSGREYDFSSPQDEADFRALGKK